MVRTMPLTATPDWKPVTSPRASRIGGSRLNASNWTFYQLPFSAFINGTVPFNAADTLTIEFQAYGTAGVALVGNFWIDDLAFY